MGKKDFIKKLTRFNRLNLKWIEEPLHPSRIFDYKEITKSLNSIALGEAFTSYEESKNINIK